MTTQKTTPSRALQTHKGVILDIAKQFGANNIRVFGSALHGTDTEESDLDLLVDMPEGTTLIEIIGLEQAIGDILGIRVEVLTSEDLSGSFREKVLLEARPLCLRGLLCPVLW